MTNHPLSRRSLHYHQPVFPKIVMLVSTIYLRLSKETRHKHPRLRARLIQLCFGMLKPGIMSSIWYLLPSSKGTQWGECAGAVTVPQWPKWSRDVQLYSSSSPAARIITVAWSDSEFQAGNSSIKILKWAAVWILRLRPVYFTYFKTINIEYM